MKKVFKVVILCFILNYVYINSSFAQEAKEYYEQIYLTEKDALSLVFEDLKIEKKEIKLSEDKKKIIQKRLKRKIKEDYFSFYIGTKDWKIQKYALILDEVGKHFPITFITSLNQKGEVEQVSIMTYREKRGSDVKRKRFLNQFKNKSTKDAIEIDNDIINLTGATISSWSIAAGVKKVVVLTEELLLK